MSPLEKAPRPACDGTEGREETYETGNITDTQSTCNTKTLPPGFGFEAGAIVPTTLPPIERETLTSEQALLRVVGHACSWSDGNPVRWQSFLVCAGFDSRPLSEVAESLRVSPRLIQMRVAECREWLAELRAELESEARP